MSSLHLPHSPSRENPTSRKATSRRVANTPRNNRSNQVGERIETPARPLRILAMGGGTGLSALLHGLKRFSIAGADSFPPDEPLLDLAAVVTVSDEGGSSGRLRKEFDILAPGDIRNCMVALAEDEALLSRLFQYRFDGGRGLAGHSFGNLFLTALTNVTGDFQQAIQLSSEVLAIRGRIYPSTLVNVRLEARFNDGATRVGETRIAQSTSGIRTLRLRPRICPPLPETLEAIERADVISLGPGSLYTSVMPNLLVRGIPEAIGSSKAVKVYICNLMWEPGETDGYTAADHLRAIHRHAPEALIDYVAVNNGRIPAGLRRRYREQKAFPVEAATAELRALGVSVIESDFVMAGRVLRHDPERLTRLLIELGRAKRSREAGGS